MTADFPSTHRYDRSIAAHREALELLAGGVSSNFRLGMHPVPLFFTRGEGARLFDVDGNAYVDYALGMGPVILGHAPAAVLEAGAATLADGQLFAGQHHGELELARRFQQHVPCAELADGWVVGDDQDACRPRAGLPTCLCHTGLPALPATAPTLPARCRHSATICIASRTSSSLTLR